MKSKSKLIRERGGSGFDRMRDGFSYISRKDASAVERSVSKNRVRLVTSS